MSAQIDFMSPEAVERGVPHCDQRILHAPGECVYCDDYPDVQQNRIAQGVAFTGCAPRPGQRPCPADAARPAGSRSDHRRWGGNKPTSAAGDPNWPAESFASVVMYGDQGGRQPWPLAERIRRRLSAPVRNLRMRLAGWHKDGPFWRYP